MHNTLENFHQLLSLAKGMAAESVKIAEEAIEKVESPEKKAEMRSLLKRAKEGKVSAEEITNLINGN